MTAAARWMAALKLESGFVGAHSDTFELLQLAEEVLDQVTPFVHVSVDRPLLGSALMLRDDDLGARSSRSAMMALLSKAVSAISALKLNPSISGGTPIVSNRWPGSRTKRTIAEGVGEREDLGRQTAFGSADGLALSPPLRLGRGDGP